MKTINVEIIPENVKEKMITLIKHNYDAYIIGGAVRDIILNKKPHDYDINTNATGEEILELFPKGIVIGNEERQNKILTVIVDKIEISQYRSNGDRTQLGNNLKIHLSTCDFAMNALAMDIAGNIIDLHDGFADIKMNKVRCVGCPENRFKEDPLRILRAIRQSLQLNFKIDSDLHDALYENMILLKKISIHRIREEFLLMLKYPNCFEILTYYGILSYFLPEIETAQTLNGGDFHDETVFEHLNYAFKESLKLTDKQMINLACFLHDIGKSTAYNFDDGKVSFLRHQYDSIKIAERFMMELKFSNKYIKFVTTMIKHHMMGGVDKLKDSTIIKIFNDLESSDISIEDMLIMTYSDNQGNQAKSRCKFNEFYQSNNWLRRIYMLKYQRKPFTVKDLEINGKDCMALGLKGKEIGDKLNKILKLVIDGDLSNDRHLLMKQLKDNNI